MRVHDFLIKELGRGVPELDLSIEVRRPCRTSCSYRRRHGPSAASAWARAPPTRRISSHRRELLCLGIKEFVNYKLIDVVDINAEF
jgi:hypothetical protein